ncbi:MAG: rhodanese-like domain-containing protein [Helicobacteraceae bacterium]|jgi:adenylyltransferase/sulfurtransferase|nr:rhodanese-like domain-containing protein [Helicobacteraceae bacterium]
MNAKKFSLLSEQKTIDVATLEALLSARATGEADFVLIDTREKYERMRCYIDGTDVVLHASGFYPKVKKLKDKERLYILYCSNGSRSALSAQTMRELGYTRVLNLSRGINACNASAVIAYGDSRPIRL